MAAYTVNTTAPQENVLDAVLTFINAQRAARTPPLSPITKATLVQNLFDDKVSDARQQVLGRQREPIIPALDGASNTQINQIKAILGLP